MVLSILCVSFIIQISHVGWWWRGADLALPQILAELIGPDFGGTLQTSLHYTPNYRRVRPSNAALYLFTSRKKLRRWIQLRASISENRKSGQPIRGGTDLSFHAYQTWNVRVIYAPNTKKKSINPVSASRSSPSGLIAHPLEKSLKTSLLAAASRFICEIPFPAC